MLFIDSAFTVHLVGQGTVNPGYSNDIYISLSADFLIRYF